MNGPQRAKRCLREVISRDGRGVETLSCGHTQWARYNDWGYRLSEARQRECETCQKEEADRESERIAAFGGPRIFGGGDE